jgi:hypothetical protein
LSAIDVITDVTVVGLQDQLLFNVTPPVIDVITDVTRVGSQDQLLLNVTPPAIDVCEPTLVTSVITSMTGGVTLSNN